VATPTSVERAAAARTATSSLLSYIIHTTPFIDIGGFHLLAIDHLEALERGDFDRLMINVPPRHGKTELVKRFGGYHLGKFPDDMLMICSYGAELAYEISYDVRAQLTDSSYPFNVRVQAGRAAVKRWGIEGRRGGVVAAGVGGAITGKGANILIIDDPVKDREQADSPTWRDKTWRWYRDTAYTRLMPGGKVIVIQTRWHQGDLSGLLIDAMQNVVGADEWVVLNLPALAYGSDEWPEYIPPESRRDPLGRRPGQALWPEWYDEEKLARIHATMSAGVEGPRGWRSLYQQNPTAIFGGVFQREWMGQRFATYHELDIKRIGIFVDSAFIEGVATAFSVAAVWAETPSGFALLDESRARVGFDELLQMIRDCYETWRARVPGIIPEVVIENKASGISAIQVLSKGQIPVTPWPDPNSPSERKLATASKEARADQATVPFRAGKIWLPRSAPWIADWVTEHTDFPTAIFKDRVDTTGMMVSRFYSVVEAASAGDLEEQESYWANQARVRGFSTGFRGGEDGYLGHFRRGGRGEQTAAIDD